MQRIQVVISFALNKLRYDGRPLGLGLVVDKLYATVIILLSTYSIQTLYNMYVCYYGCSLGLGLVIECIFIQILSTCIIFRYYTMI